MGRPFKCPYCEEEGRTPTPEDDACPDDERFVFGSCSSDLRCDASDALDADGAPITRATAPVCWGGVGTNVQHAFFQWLHQSPDVVPVDLIGVRTPHHQRPDHHRQLIANLIGQANALMHGRSRQQTSNELLARGMPQAEVDQLAPHCTFPGNRPSTIILLDSLTPTHLGSLLALYEHKIFVQGVIWNVNSFDQWGVELGKQLASTIADEMQDDVECRSHDSSTNTLINTSKGSTGRLK